jgi:hypothetical protein
MTLAIPATSAAQARIEEPQERLPSIAEKTAGMRQIDGFLPLYWDDGAGHLWMEINRLDTEVLHFLGIGAGLGSNDIGIDRGQLAGSRIVRFERVGRKILMVQPNYRFRAHSDNLAEVRAVTDAFARSVLWGFTAATAAWNVPIRRRPEFGLPADDQGFPKEYRNRNRTHVHPPTGQRWVWWVRRRIIRGGWQRCCHRRGSEHSGAPILR